MASSRFEHVRIAGMASAVPGPARSVFEGAQFPADEVTRISASTGVERRYLAPADCCASDLCRAAADVLIAAMSVPKESIDVLIFVSQTPDYVLPATACAIHGRMGLASTCAAFDVNLGCSGYVYGLWLASSLLQSGAARVLLLAGDTSSRIVSPRDRSTALLFGDAGTATLLERSPGAPPICFELGTDGSGAEHLIVPAGGFRMQSCAATALRSEREGGNVRSDDDLFMNGGEIFAFTMLKVPSLCKAVLKQAGWTVEETDAFVMHQANRSMLQLVSKLMRLPSEKTVIALENFGNTSSASIPLALSASMSERLRTASAKLVLAGFGVGFSWAAAAVETTPMNMPEILHVTAETPIEVGNR